MLVKLTTGICNVSIILDPLRECPGVNVKKVDNLFRQRFLVYKTECFFCRIDNEALRKVEYSDCRSCAKFETRNIPPP